MTGTFSAAVLSQIQGQTSAPLPAQTSSKAAVTTSASSTTSNKPTGTQSSTASQTQNQSSGVNVRAGWAGAALAAIVGASLF